MGGPLQARSKMEMCEAHGLSRSICLRRLDRMQCEGRLDCGSFCLSLASVFTQHLASWGTGNGETLFHTETPLTPGSGCVLVYFDHMVEDDTFGITLGSNCISNASPLTTYDQILRGGF